MDSYEGPYIELQCLFNVLLLESFLPEPNFALMKGHPVAYRVNVVSFTLRHGPQAAVPLQVLPEYLLVVLEEATGECTNPRTLLVRIATYPEFLVIMAAAGNLSIDREPGWLKAHLRDTSTFCYVMGSAHEVVCKRGS